MVSDQQVQEVFFDGRHVVVPNVQRSPSCRDWQQQLGNTEETQPGKVDIVVEARVQ